MPKSKKIEDLTPNYKEATKELMLAYRRLGTVQKHFKKGNIDEARKLVGHVKHYVKDALGLLGVTEPDAEKE